MRLRSLSVVAVAALALGGLSACTSKVGVAAVVGGHHISDSDVNDYLTPKAVPFQLADSTGAPQTVRPKVYVLQALVVQRVFETTLAHTSGGVPSNSDVDQIEQQLTQGATVAQQQAQYTKYGFKPSFAAIDLRVEALEQLLAQRVNAQSGTQLVAAVQKQKIAVSVSPRYGRWDASTLAVDGTAGAPSFVTLQPSPAAAALPTD